MATSGGIAAAPRDARLGAIVKRGVVADGDRLGGHGLDAGERRRLGAERGRERVERRCVALGLDRDPVAVVQDEPAEPVPAGETVDERAETDPLDDAP